MTSSWSSIGVAAAFWLGLVAFQTHPACAQDTKQLVGACTACHPPSAVPANSVNPIIWGQNEGYVYIQLRDFKRSARASQSDVAMHALTQAMTDSQMLAIAQYVAAQPWPKPQGGATPTTDPLFRRGAQLVAYGDCGACHFNNWQGYSANPRLRGQTPAYLMATLNEFRSGARGNSPGMSDFVRAYSPEDLKAMVAYLSSVE